MALLTYVPLKVPAWGEKRTCVCVQQWRVGRWAFAARPGSIPMEWTFRLSREKAHAQHGANNGKENNLRKNQANNKNKQPASEAQGHVWV